MLFNALALISLLPLSSAHFVLEWPAARGSDASKAGTFPCGGFNSVKTPRTEWPIMGGPVQLRMDHPQTNVKILMAIGDDPGSNFNIVLRPMFAQEGFGKFCAAELSVPEGVNVTDGTPATIQVVTNGHADGGLYSCADVILTNQQSLVKQDWNSQCKNGSVNVFQENMSGSPNETTTGEEPSPTSGDAAATASPTGAAHHTTVSSLMGMAGIVGFALMIL